MPIVRVALLWFVALGVLLVAGCGGGGGGATAATGSIQGYIYGAEDGPALAVTRAEGIPVQNAEIRVQGTRLSTRTDKDGYFHLSGVPTGSRTLLISASGYESISVAVTVAQNKTTDVSTGTLNPVTRKWTVLVYLNADNDLEGYGVEDVNEMEQIDYSSGAVTVAVQMDRAPGWDTSNDNWQDTRRFVIQHDTNTQVMTSALNPLEIMGEVNMGHPNTLRDFIAWGKESFPAERYLLVIWNHGSGWRSASQPSVTRGISFDDSTTDPLQPYYISTTALPGALTTSPPLDMVAFDASLMQMLEVAYEIRNTTPYVVGSEESPPGAGYPYHTWLGPLVQAPTMSTEELGTLMARSPRDYYGTNSNITHSVLKSAELEGLVSAVDSFALALKGRAVADADKLAEARDQSEAFAYYDYKDLYHFAQLVQTKVTDPTLRNAAGSVMTAVSRAVVAEFHGSQHANAHGVSIWLPTSTIYNRWAGSYAALAFAKNTHWDEWLAAQTK